MNPIEKKAAIEGWLRAAESQLKELEEGKARIQPIRRRRFRGEYGPEDSYTDYSVTPSAEDLRRFMIGHTKAVIRAKEAELSRVRFEAADYAEELAASLRAEARDGVTRAIGGDA